MKLAPAPSDSEEVAKADDAAFRRDSEPTEESLGISVQPLSQEDARDPQLRSVTRSGGALVVTQVSPDGPAYQKLADPSSGYPDIILRVNGHQTRTRADFRQAMASVKAGEIVTLTVLSRTPNGWQQRVVRLRAR